jgi:mono/diheme cytochrome c family protein/glucose/arabinose dehydrogenase
MELGPRTRLAAAVMALIAASLGTLVATGDAIQNRGAWPPAVRKTPDAAPPLSAEEERQTIVVPPGYRAELVAEEPLVVDPIAIDFDADGRMWVLEMPGFMPDISGRDSREAINDVAVLEDTNGDGIMDKRTVFADRLLLPRAIKTLEGGAALIGEPPNLWLMKDINGDLRADTKTLLSDSFGRAEGNIEHNANNLLWALDNVIYTSEHDWHLRWAHGTFETVPTLSRGQWGGSQDDAGRVYRNFNDAPLFVDYIAPGYYMRNGNLVRTRGLYDPLITREESIVWPVRATRGVNRGYRDQFFRADGSSVTIQGAGTPVIFRGDRLPRELQGQAFITDSPTNLVHAYRIVDEGTGRLHAEDFYKQGEIFASWDERCRPVNLASAPDGTLYIVDMYRGVVQDGAFWTDYLRDYIRARHLELPVKRGRIWRIVHDGMRPGARPRLSSATAAQLVRTLAHPNGWWRDTAQQLLVQRGDKSVVPALRELAAGAPDWRARLHALWTLDGLDAIEPSQVVRALADAAPEVRASAIRLSERWLAASDDPLATAVLNLIDDSSWTVRRQLAASIGELPPASRPQAAAAMLERYGTDPIVVDATISGLRDREAAVLGRLERPGAPPGPTEAIAMLAAAMARSGDAAAVERLIARATEASNVDATRLALLRGIDMGLAPSGGGGGSGAGSGGRGSALSRIEGRGNAAPARTVAVPAEPAELIRLAAAESDAGKLAKSIAGKIDWPGKPVPVADAAPLTEHQQRRYSVGADLYKNICLGCHQADGRGREKLAPDLVQSRYVTSVDAGAATRILLGGKEGETGLMPPLGSALDDEQVASLLTYIRREWGHTASAVAPEDVREIRGLSKTRTRPWTDAELQQVRGGR